MSTQDKLKQILRDAGYSGGLVKMQREQLLASTGLTEGGLRKLEMQFWSDNGASGSSYPRIKLSYYQDVLGCTASSITGCEDEIAELGINPWEPSTSFTILNDADKGTGIVLTNGGLSVADTSLAWKSVRSVDSVSADVYFELTIDSFTSGTFSCPVGVMTSASSLGTFLGANIDAWAFQANGATTIRKQSNSSFTNFAGRPSVSVGSVIGVAYKGSTGEIWGRDSAGYFEGDPVAGTGASFTGISGTIHAAVSANGATGSAEGTLNFGQNAFTYAVPTGYSAGIIV